MIEMTISELRELHAKNKQLRDERDRLRKTGRWLSILALQSKRYTEDLEFRKATDKMLALSEPLVAALADPQEGKDG